MPDQGGPPDFVGIGTQMAGTEWWIRMLAKHPQLHPSIGEHGGLRWFQPFCNREMTKADVARYHSLFPRQPGKLVGEWSSRYLFDVWTHPLLVRAAPDAKFLVLLRDPIERYRSALALRLGQEMSRTRGMVYTTEAIHRARYASQLRVLSGFIDLERVLVIQYEKVLTDPLGQYARTMRFLGVDDSFAPSRFRYLSRNGGRPKDPERLLRPFGIPTWVNTHGLAHRRRRAATNVHLWPDIHSLIVEELHDDVLGLEELVPEFDLSLWPAFTR